MPVYPLWVGADHGDDLQYVFGKPFSTPLGYFPRHRDVAKYIISYWTNFAQTGYLNILYFYLGVNYSFSIHFISTNENNCI